MSDTKTLVFEVKVKTCDIVFVYFGKKISIAINQFVSPSKCFIVGVKL